MEEKVKLEGVYKPSENVVARNIEGEILIVPLVSGIGDVEDELFTLNETGKIIWEQLDGQNTLKDVVRDMSAEFDADDDEIAGDVIGFVSELFKRNMLVEVSNG